MDVVDSPDKGRFEMAVPGGTAFATYRRAGDVLIVPHTEVPREAEGKEVSRRPKPNAVEVEGRCALLKR